MVGSHHNHVENVLTMFWAVSYQCIIKPLTIIAKHSILDVAAALNAPLLIFLPTYNAQKMKFFIKDFFSKCDQIRSFLRIWSHLLEKYLMENFIFCAVIPIMIYVT